MHVYYLKRPGRDHWEPCSHLVACLLFKGLARAPRIYGEWGVRAVFVRDLAEHVDEPQVVS